MVGKGISAINDVSYDFPGLIPIGAPSEANGIFVLLDHRPNHLGVRRVASSLASADTASL